MCARQSCQLAAGAYHEGQSGPKLLSATSRCAPAIKKCMALPARSLARLMSVAGMLRTPIDSEMVECTGQPILTGRSLAVSL